MNDVSENKKLLQILSDRIARCILYLAHSEGISEGTLEEELKASPTTIRKRLDKLEEKGLLKKRKTEDNQAIYITSSNEIESILNSVTNDLDSDLDSPKNNSK